MQLTGSRNDDSHAQNIAANSLVSVAKREAQRLLASAYVAVNTAPNIVSVQYTCDADPSRRWCYTVVDATTFRLVNVHSGLVLPLPMEEPTEIPTPSSIHVMGSLHVIGRLAPGGRVVADIIVLSSQAPREAISGYNLVTFRN